MRQNGHWKKLPTATMLVPAGEVFTPVQALTFQPLAAMASARPIPTTTLVFAQHFMQTEG